MDARDTLHRSENLHLWRSSDGRRIDVEIRFGVTYARASATAVCPSCGGVARPHHWELEGPDGTNNTLWMHCDATPPCKGSDGRDLGWTTNAAFGDGWIER